MKTPKGATFRPETLVRDGYSGDNFWTTWAADDNQYTTQDDGRGWHEHGSYQNRVWRVKGGPDSMAVEDLPGYPPYPFGGAGSHKGRFETAYGYYAYGIVAVDGVLYVFLSKTANNRWWGPFQGTRLLASRDFGASWSHVAPDGTWSEFDGSADHIVYHPYRDAFFYREGERFGHGQWAYPFACNTIVQCGKDYQDASDDWVYVYSMEGVAAHELLLARAPRDRFDRRDEWEFAAGVGATGAPRWSKNLDERGPVHRFPETTTPHTPTTDQREDWFSWYSWMPSVVYNKALGVYIMANHGTYTYSLDKDTYFDHREHTKTGSLMLLWSENPRGPWTEFFYDPYWHVDDDRNRTYQTTLSQKWIEDDGRTMVLIWSDAGPDKTWRTHTQFYRWNHMKLRIETEG